MLIGVGFTVTNCWYEIGSSGVVESLRLTMVNNLSSEVLDKCPTIIQDTFNEGISAEDIDRALVELDFIIEELRSLDVDCACFVDEGDAAMHSSWCNENATNLSEVFVMVYGHNLLQYFRAVLNEAKEASAGLCIEVI